MLKSITSLLFLISFVGTVNAQMSDLNFSMTFPTSDFRYASNSVGAGFGVSVLFPIQQSIFHLGGEINYITHGHKSQRYQQFRRNLRLTTNNNMLISQFVMRIVPIQDKDAYISPYIEGVVGMNWLYTRTVLRDITVSQGWSSGNNDTNHTLDADMNNSDVTLVYGGGVGFMVGRSPLRLNLKCRYLFGGEAKYLDKKSVKFDPNYPEVINFEPKKSSTHMILPQIGIMVLW